MNWNICLSYCHYISSHMHTNYGVTAVKMSKIHPCQILFVLMMVGGAWHLWAVVNYSGLLVQYVAGHTCQLHFPRFSLSRRQPPLGAPALFPAPLCTLA